MPRVVETRAQRRRQKRKRRASDGVRESTVAAGPEKVKKIDREATVKVDVIKLCMEEMKASGLENSSVFEFLSQMSHTSTEPTAPPVVATTVAHGAKERKEMSLGVSPTESDEYSTGVPIAQATHQFETPTKTDQSRGCQVSPKAESVLRTGLSLSSFGTSIASFDAASLSHERLEGCLQKPPNAAESAPASDPAGSDEEELELKIARLIKAMVRAADARMKKRARDPEIESIKRSIEDVRAEIREHTFHIIKKLRHVEAKTSGELSCMERTMAARELQSAKHMTEELGSIRTIAKSAEAIAQSRAEVLDNPARDTSSRFDKIETTLAQIGDKLKRKSSASDVSDVIKRTIASCLRSTPTPEKNSAHATRTRKRSRGARRLGRKNAVQHRNHSSGVILKRSTRADIRHLLSVGTLVSTTGLRKGSRPSLRKIKWLIDEVSCYYSFDLTRKCGLLLVPCSTYSSEKVRYADRHRIPTVNVREFLRAATMLASRRAGGRY